jgi:hypothetical protein
VSEHPKEQRIVHAKIPKVYYWEIAEEDRYEPAKPSGDFSLGQLSEDWERIQQILQSDAPPVGYVLVWVASLLRKIGSSNVG